MQAKAKRTLLASEQAALKADTLAVEAHQRALAAEEKLAKTEAQLVTMRKEAETSRRVANTEGRALLALKARTLCRALAGRKQRAQRLSGALLSMRRNATTETRQEARVHLQELASRGASNSGAKQARQAHGVLQMGLVVKLWSACSVIQRLIEACSKSLSS